MIQKQASSNLQRAFKNASELIEEFNKLKNIPGSNFEFVLDDLFNKAILINTNISTPSSFEVSLIVQANGEIKGDDGRFYTTKEVLDFANKQVKEQGLVP